MGLPMRIRAEVDCLLAAIEGAESARCLSLGTYDAQGFVSALEAAITLCAADIEALSIGFEVVCNVRGDSLRNAPDICETN